MTYYLFSVEKADWLLVTWSLLCMCAVPIQSVFGCSVWLYFKTFSTTGTSQPYLCAYPLLATTKSNSQLGPVTEACSANCSVNSKYLKCLLFTFSLSSQISVHTRRVLPGQTYQLQPSHQSQQPLLHLSRDGRNQLHASHRLREWPAPLPVVGASQWGFRKLEQRSRGSCVCLNSL